MEAVYLFFAHFHHDGDMVWYFSCSFFSVCYLQRYILTRPSGVQTYRYVDWMMID